MGKREDQTKAVLPLVVVMQPTAYFLNGYEIGDRKFGNGDYASCYSPDGKGAGHFYRREKDNPDFVLKW